MSIFKQKFPEPSKEEISVVKSKNIFERLLYTVIHSIDEIIPNCNENVRQTNPCFSGSYDWHSCVHSFWSIIQILKNDTNNPLKEKSLKILSNHFTKNNLSKEINNLDNEEYPYGFAWFLVLVGALHSFKNEKSEEYIKIFNELENKIKKIFIEKLLNNPKAESVSEGQHYNTAFAMILLFSYAKQINDTNLLNLIIDKSKNLFINNPPFTEEKTKYCFLSNNLCVLHLMSLTMEKNEFIKWAETKNWEIVLKYEPVFFDVNKPYECHDCGLNFSRSWNYYTLSNLFEKEKELLVSKARDHYNKSIDFVPMGNWIFDHYLGTFCLMAVLSEKNKDIFN